jgi:hypothetical protein
MGCALKAEWQKNKKTKRRGNFFIRLILSEIK